MKRLIRRTAEYIISFDEVKQAAQNEFEVLDGIVDGQTAISLMSKLEALTAEAGGKVGLTPQCFWKEIDDSTVAQCQNGNVYFNCSENALNYLRSNIESETIKWFVYHEVGHVFDQKSGWASDSEEWNQLLANDTSGLAEWGKESYDDYDLSAEAFANAFFAIYGGDGYGLESQEIIDYIKGLN